MEEDNRAARMPRDPRDSLLRAIAAQACAERAAAKANGTPIPQEAAERLCRDLSVALACPPERAAAMLPKARARARAMLSAARLAKALSVDALAQPLGIYIIYIYP